jgi:hypothetical protein
MSSHLQKDIKGLSWCCRKRRFFWTHNGRFGLGPPHLECSDVIVCLLGGLSLYALRHDGEQYKYVGDCAMDGLMNGEAVAEIEIDSKLDREASLLGKDKSI